VVSLLLKNVIWLNCEAVNPEDPMINLPAVPDPPFQFPCQPVMTSILFEVQAMPLLLLNVKEWFPVPNAMVELSVKVSVLIVSV